MKKIEIDLGVCKEVGANAAVCLAVVNNYTVRACRL